MKLSSTFCDQGENDSPNTTQDAMMRLLQTEADGLQAMIDAADRNIRFMDEISARWNRRGEVQAW